MNLSKLWEIVEDRGAWGSAEGMGWGGEVAPVWSVPDSRLRLSPAQQSLL